MKLVNNETSEIVNPVRALSLDEINAISGGKGKQPVCTTTVSTSTKGNTTTTTVTTTCK